LILSAYAEVVCSSRVTRAASGKISAAIQGRSRAVAQLADEGGDGRIDRGRRHGRIPE